MLNGKKNKQLREAIFHTVAFFDLFDYPLTVFEIWRYLGAKCDLIDILMILESRYDLYTEPSVIDKIDEKNGMFFLASRSKICKTRLNRYNYSERKFKRALFISGILKFIPWIKMIAVSNMIGADNLKDESDIDLFIITEKKRVWISRLFSVAIIKLLKLRPEPGREKDKICLSFFIANDSLNIKNLMLPDKKDTRDIYFIYWLSALAPIYDTGGIYEKFLHENNWVHFFIPNWRPTKIVHRRIVKKSPSNIYNDIIELFIGGLEENVKRWQLKIMPEVLARPINKDTRVVANDSIIKLHAKDRREEYRDNFYKKISSVK